MLAAFLILSAASFILPTIQSSFRLAFSYMPYALIYLLDYGYGYRICLLHARHVTVTYLFRNRTLALAPGMRYE